VVLAARRNGKSVLPVLAKGGFRFKSVSGANPESVLAAI
jgi:hypothetical protein